MPANILYENAEVNGIQSFIKQNKMTVIFYCAPFCKNNKNRDFTFKLKEKIQGFQDFSKVINDDTMFQNCNHLNDSGARRFTEIFTEQLLMN